MFKPSRCASFGYFASNREKFRRARDGEQFGNALGFLPISAHRCIAFASRSWRISGRAFMFSFSSSEPCVVSDSYSSLSPAEFSNLSRMMAILRIRQTDQIFQYSKNSDPQNGFESSGIKLQQCLNILQMRENHRLI
jgi:hypothetical protein